METKKSTVSPEEMEDQKALFLVRWMPRLVVVPLIFVVVAVVGVFKHPGVSNLIRLITPIGGTLYCLFYPYWTRSVLAGRPRLGLLLMGVLGLVMGGSGSIVSSAYRHGDMLRFFVFGGLLLTMAVICLSLFVNDLVGQRRAERQAPDSPPDAR